MRLLLRAVWLALLVMLVLLAVPVLAFAQDAGQNPTLVLPGDQTWVLIIGGLVPLVTYVLNHVGPWLTEPMKAFVLALVSAIAAALYTAIATNVFGWNGRTLQLVLSGVIAAFVAHKLIWLPAGVSILLGGGSNRQTSRNPARVAATRGPGEV